MFSHTLVSVSSALLTPPPLCHQLSSSIQLLHFLPDSLDSTSQMEDISSHFRCWQGLGEGISQRRCEKFNLWKRAINCAHNDRELGAGALRKKKKALRLHSKNLVSLRFIYLFWCGRSGEPEFAPHHQLVSDGIRDRGEHHDNTFRMYSNMYLAL
ncbi:hypothetical protein FIBSPDRAFT_67665 [Athelia psychrophila]|uniref:Uncharacterized protein n=1 Tax=Athelia psychrophila TaxID=1759441 RepID=A0A166EVB5_9AGAM|nr:hypothetical protein FIBSPDRAFT_67665 [Fibularhizoctonia sp. CBS 109695]